VHWIVCQINHTRFVVVVESRSAAGEDKGESSGQGDVRRQRHAAQETRETGADVREQETATRELGAQTGRAPGRSDREQGRSSVRTKSEQGPSGRHGDEPEHRGARPWETRSSTSRETRGRGRAGSSARPERRAGGFARAHGGGGRAGEQEAEGRALGRCSREQD
jgi:hypothetical protein